MNKKITLATFKSFIKKNANQLLINVGSSFDGMSDMVEQTGDFGFNRPLDAAYPCKNNLGIQQIWLVFGSRDYFREFETDDMTGIRCFNCCGSFTVAIPKQ